MRAIIVATTLLCLSLGCKDQRAAPNAPATTQAAQATEEATYGCPMRCVPEGQDTEHLQKGPGTCPVCKMKLVPADELE